MPYLIELTEDKQRMTAPLPMGPGFTAEQADNAVRMETWGSSFRDPGPDWCEFRLFDANNKVVAIRRTEGY
jgi:hypothetical protein